MDYLSYNVAVNLKQIRQSKGMSLGEVAEQTGVSKSMLAQIEKGTANPSLGVLGKITSGLRIEFQTLIDPPREDFCIVNPKEIFPTKELEGQYKVWTCFPYEDSHSVEVYRIDIEPGGVYMSGSHGEKTSKTDCFSSFISINMHLICFKFINLFFIDYLRMPMTFYRKYTFCYCNVLSCFFLDYTGLR